MRWIPTALLALAALTLAAPSQKLPSFDAASVKPFTIPAGGWAWGAPKMDPRHFSMPGSPLRDIILKAYGIDDYQLIGLPDWAAHEFFTITATTTEPTSPEQMLLMLRQLLRYRFQLQMVESQTERSVFAIVAAAGGPKLKPLTDEEECPTGINGDMMKAAGAPTDSMSGFNGCTLADLVKSFNRPSHTQEIGRPVIDKTGLTGRYHMLVWQSTEIDDTYTGPGTRYSYMEPFREAVEKELGLKLVEDTQTLKQYNVTHVARPNAD